jgi:hypothetical protein
MIDWLNSNSGALLAILTLAYVVCTIWLARSARKANRTAVELHAAIYRPVVECDFFTKYDIMYFRVRNVGMRSARDITIEVVEEPPPQARDPLSQKSAITDGVSFLGPSSELVMSYSLPQDNDLPRVEFKMSYSDDNDKKYDNEYSIDLGAWLHEDLGREHNDPIVQKLGAIEKAISGLEKSC